MVSRMTSRMVVSQVSDVVCGICCGVAQLERDRTLMIARIVALRYFLNSLGESVEFAVGFLIASCEFVGCLFELLSEYVSLLVPLFSLCA